MSRNRIRVLFVSLLAVFAVSAVASASASAAGQCYKVSTAKTGRFESWGKCTWGAPVIVEGEWINTSKLETELKPAEWCAKVETAKTGTFKNAACTEAEAKGEFIKVHVPIFWLCREAGTEEYENHLCAKKIAGGKWSYLPVEKAELYAFEGTSGVSKLESELGGKRVIIECKKDKITGELESGGRTKNVVITYEECKLFQVVKYIKTELPKCVVGTAGTITTNKLNDFLITGKGIGPEDEFEPAEGTTFVKIKIAGAECALASEEAVTGKQICQLPEATVGKVEHEVVCSPSGGSLVLGTKAASYYGTANIKLTNGWSWGAEP